LLQCSPALQEYLGTKTNPKFVASINSLSAIPALKFGEESFSIIILKNAISKIISYFKSITYKSLTNLQLNRFTIDFQKREKFLKTGQVFKTGL